LAHTRLLDNLAFALKGSSASSP